MQLTPLLCLGVAGLTAAMLPAQIQPGNSIAAAVRGTPALGELYAIDHQAGTATQLTISAALASAVTNTIEMVNGALGYVGSNPVAPATGDIYRITISGTTVTETKLNTTASAGANVAQIVQVGSNLYFTTQDAASSTSPGVLQSVPVAGGAITKELDLATVTGAAGLANAVAAVGPFVYVATFDSGTTANTGCIVRYDTVAKTGSLVLNLPKGKFVSGTSTFNVGPVHMRPHPANPSRLVIQGVYGDWLIFDSMTATIVSHGFAGFGTPTSGVANTVNSFDIDQRTGDYIVGSRDDHIERAVSDHSAEKIIKLGATTSSVAGLDHIQAPKGHDMSVGPGCPGSGGYTLTDVPYGLPIAGNAGFAFGVHSGYGGNPVSLVFGLTDPNVKLDPVPMPGCVLHVDFFLAIPMTLTGTGNGLGKAKLPVAIPAAALGAKVYRQWFEVQLGGTKSNPVGLVVSNGRETIVQ